MRVARVALHLIKSGDECHVINLKLLLNAYIEKSGDYPIKYGIRYYMDTAIALGDEDGQVGDLITFASKKAAFAAMAALAAATDTLLVEEEE